MTSLRDEIAEALRSAAEGDHCLAGAWCEECAADAVLARLREVGTVQTRTSRLGAAPEVVRERITLPWQEVER